MSEKFAVRASTGMADYSKNMSLAETASEAERILGFDSTTTYNTDFVSTMFYSPELMPDVWQMARSQNELRKWHVAPEQLIPVKGYGFKKIKDIEIGDEVVSFGSNFVKVINKVSKQHKGKKITITPHLIHLPIHLLDNHPMLVIKRPLKENGLPRSYYTHIGEMGKSKDIMGSYARMVPSQSIERGDLLVLPKTNITVETPKIDLSTYAKNYKTDNADVIEKYNKKLPRYFPINEDVAKVMGWYVAEGHSGDHAVMFSLGDKEWEQAEWIKNVLRQNLGLGDKQATVVRKDNKYPRVSVNCIAIRNLFEDMFGHGARNKHLPEWLIYAPKNIAQAFLDGWYEGDKGTTVSQRLSQDIFKMVLNTGRLPYYYTRKITTEQILGKKLKSYAKIAYSLNWNDDKLQEQKYLEDEHYFYIPIQEITVQDYDGMGYDILTEDQSYCLPFVSYSCASHEHIATEATTKEISELHIGQKILSAMGKNQNIVDKISREYNGPMQQIETGVFPSTHLTDADMVLGVKVNRPYFNEQENERFKGLIHTSDKSLLKKHLTWITASLVSPDDLMVTPRFKEVKEVIIDLSKYIPQNIKGKTRYSVLEDYILCKTAKDEYTINRYIKMDDNLAELLGYYYVSGTSNKFYVQFHSTLIQDRVKQLLQKIWGIKEQYIERDKNGFKVSIKIPLLAEWFCSLGVGNRNKKKLQKLLCTLLHIIQRYF